MAAHFQNKHPNPCKYSKDGFFGSKFVTVIVTGRYCRIALGEKGNSGFQF